MPIRLVFPVRVFKTVLPFLLDSLIAMTNESTSQGIAAAGILTVLITRSWTLLILNSERENNHKFKGNRLGYPFFMHFVKKVPLGGLPNRYIAVL